MSKQQSIKEIIEETEALIAAAEGGRIARVVSGQAPAPTQAAPQRPKRIRVTYRPKKRQADPEFKQVNPGDLAIYNLYVYDQWLDKMPEDKKIFIN